MDVVSSWAVIVMFVLLVGVVNWSLFVGSYQRYLESLEGSDSDS